MAQFSYKALTATGDLRAGTLDAATREAAGRQLAADGLIPISIDKPAGASPAGNLFQREAKPAQVTRFLSDLAVLLSAGIKLDDALVVIGREFDNGPLQPVVLSLARRISEGGSMSQAMGAWPRLFPPLQVALTEVAESSGRLPQLMTRLAEERQRFEALSARLGSALRYPAVLLAGTIAVLIFFMMAVVPQFEPLLAQGGDQDALVAGMIRFSGFLRENGRLLGAAVLMGAAALWLAARSGALMPPLVRLVRRMPLASTLAQNYRTARFARLFGIMAETGIAVPRAIRLAGMAVDGAAGAETQVEAASDAVRRGDRISAALEILQLPDTAVRMLRIGEESGMLVPLSFKVAEFYETRVDAGLSRLTGVIGPAAVVLVSLLIGGMIVSIMSTIMSVNDLVR
ncbi:MAG: type II secretion system F family protein [Rhizobiaceae bacterium]|jgi:general secretion pathway protein F|nr:type II secretion system F family protein [Rhizobiaceae bacterium]